MSYIKTITIPIPDYPTMRDLVAFVNTRLCELCKNMEAGRPANIWCRVSLQEVSRERLVYAYWLEEVLE